MARLDYLVDALNLSFQEQFPGARLAGLATLIDRENGIVPIWREAVVVDDGYELSGWHRLLNTNHETDEENGNGADPEIVETHELVWAAYAHARSVGTGSDILTRAKSVLNARVQTSMRQALKARSITLRTGTAEVQTREVLNAQAPGLALSAGEEYSALAVNYTIVIRYLASCDEVSCGLAEEVVPATQTFCERVDECTRQWRLDLEADLADESQARAAADAALAAAIQAEAAARQQRDDQLQAAIDNIGPGGGVSEQYVDDAVAAEATSRQQADAILADAINAEALARQTGDNNRYTKGEADALLNAKRNTNNNDYGGARLTNLGTPTDPTDAATKGYADTQDGLRLIRDIDPYTLPVLPYNPSDPTWVASGVAEQFGIVGDIWVTQRGATVYYDTVGGAPVTTENPNGRYVHAWRGVNGNLAFRLNSGVPGVLPLESPVTSSEFSIPRILFEGTRSTQWTLRDVALTATPIQLPRNISILMLVASSLANNQPLFCLTPTQATGQLLSVFVNSGFLQMGVSSGNIIRHTKQPGNTNGIAKPVVLGLTPMYPAIGHVGTLQEFMSTEITSNYFIGANGWNNVPQFWTMGRDGLGGANRFGTFRIAGFCIIKHPNSGYRMDLVQAVQHGWIAQHNWQI